MKFGGRHIDGWHLLALGLISTPFAAVFVLGMLWLWQSPHRLWWLAGIAGVALLGYGLQYFLRRSQRQLLAEVRTPPDPHWPPSAEQAWERVVRLVDQLDPDEWPLSEPGRLVQLGRLTLETVARCYHPDQKRPLLELTLPHALLIIERASRDLRCEITEHIPFSHRLVVGDILRAQRWKNTAENLFGVYRIGRVVVNPLDALIGEIKRHAMGSGMDLAGNEMQRWLLREYVFKVGRYAIDLYSGRLPLEGDEDVTAGLTATSRRDLERAAAAEDVSQEPLHIVVLGRQNSGKSSLINALFERAAALADVLPDTTAGVTPYVLESEGLTRALIYDTPALDSRVWDSEAILKQVAEADLVLWVTPVHRPDRQHERQVLDAIRADSAARPQRQPAPVIVVASHIDRLRPLVDWSPPYDLSREDDAKAVNIRAATEAVAGDLDVPLANVVPVCLAEGRVYNVSDTLWAAILAQQDDAHKARWLRCLEQRRREQDWALVWQQLKGAGRLLRKWRSGDR